MKRVALLLVSALGLSTYSYADVPSTINIINNLDVGVFYSDQSIDGLHDYDVVSLTTEYHFSPYFSVDARVGTGSSDYSVSLGSESGPTGRYSEDIDYQIALLLKGRYEVIQHLHLVGFVGGAKSKLDIERVGSSSEFANDFSTSVKSTGWTYGIAVEYQPSENLTFSVEYQVLPDLDIGNDGLDWDAASIGMRYHF